MVAIIDVFFNNTIIIRIGKISFLQVECNDSPCHNMDKEVVVKTEEEKEKFISVNIKINDCVFRNIFL